MRKNPSLQAESKNRHEQHRKEKKWDSEPEIPEQIQMLAG
jgi:hypothetical protein